MSIKAMSTVWADKSIMDREQLLLLLAIADYLNDDDNSAWPAVATLAMKTRSSEQTVKRMVKKSVEEGRIRVRYGAGPKGTNLYEFVFKGGDQPEPPGGYLPDTGGVSARPPGGVSARSKGGICQIPQTIIEPSREPVTGTRRVPTLHAEDFPEVLRTESFADVWLEWTEYRKQSKRPLTPIAIRRQLSALALFGETWAVERIGTAIERGWRGLVFADDVPGKTKAKGNSSYGKNTQSVNPLNVGVAQPLPGETERGQAKIDQQQRDRRARIDAEKARRALGGKVAGA